MLADCLVDMLTLCLLEPFTGTTANSCQAFNAGLVIFAATHVAHDDCKSDTERFSRWKFVEKALPYFNMAIEALQNLDRGNRVVERCVSYLSQLSLAPLSPGMFLPLVHMCFSLVLSSPVF